MNAVRRNKWSAAAIIVVAVAFGIWLGTALDFAPSTSAQTVTPQGVADARPILTQASGEFYSDDSPIIRVVEHVKDAVVNIEAESEPDKDDSRSRNEWFPGFFHPPVGRTQSFGSGFFIKSDGTVLTNAHVVADADVVTVRLSDEHEYKAKILGVDRETDLAVLKISPDNPVPYIDLAPNDNLKIGQWVVAIGNPFPRQRLDRTVTVGVVSGVGRSALNFGDETPTYQNYIQTDAAINPGNSGGPLVDLHGDAVGVNSAIASPSGGNVGIGFAIPVSYVKAVLPELIAEGKVSRGWLGIAPGEITPDLAAAMDLPNRKGVVVQQVIDGTPAEKYGMKQGDVIVKFNGQQVDDVQQFMFLVGQTRPNSEVNIDVVRNGAPKSLAVRLAERDEAQLASANSVQQEEEPNSWLGMTLATATVALADRYSVPFEPGLIVTAVEPGSEAENKGIARGNIITSIDRQEVTGLDDFRRIKADLKDRNKPILFLVRDNRGNARFMGLKVR